MSNQMPAVEAYVNILKSITQNVDLKRSDHQFKVDDLVYVDASHFKIQSGTSKLNPINLGPFEIIKANGRKFFCSEAITNDIVKFSL